MSGTVPRAPRLRQIREAWLDRTIPQLQADPAVGAAGFVGSLGRGEADDWSDVDLLIVVDDDDLARYTSIDELPAGDVALSFDTRQNVAKGAGGFSVQYILDGLPLWVDWHIYPASMGSWVTDAAVVFDRLGLPRIELSFEEYQENREVQPAIAAPENRRLLQLGLIPIAAKHIVRRWPSAAFMVEFVGGPSLPHATPPEHLEALQRVLDRHDQEGPAKSVAAARRYLHLVKQVL